MGCHGARCGLQLVTAGQGISRNQASWLPQLATKKYSNLGPHQFTQPLCAAARKARIVCSPRPSILTRAPFNVMSFSLRGRASLLQGPGARDEHGQAALPRPQAPAQQHGASHGRGRRAGSVRVEASFMGQRLATGGARAAALPSTSLRSSAPRRSHRGAVRVNAMFERFTEKAIKAGAWARRVLFRHNPSPRHARLRLLTHHVGPSRLRLHRTLPQVVMLAQEEARRLGHNFVGTEQLLLGLIGESTGVFWHGSSSCLLTPRGTSFLLMTLKCCLPVQAADNHQMHLVRVCWAQRCVGTFLNAGCETLPMLILGCPPWAGVTSFF